MSKSSNGTPAHGVEIVPEEKAAELAKRLPPGPEDDAPPTEKLMARPVARAKKKAKEEDEEKEPLLSPVLLRRALYAGLGLLGLLGGETAGVLPASSNEVEALRRRVARLERMDCKIAKHLGIKERYCDEILAEDDEAGE